MKLSLEDALQIYKLSHTSFLFNHFFIKKLEFEWINNIPLYIMNRQKVSHITYSLVKSLTKNEKGYFIRYAELQARKEGNNYLQLFRAIEKQKTPTDTEPYKKFLSPSLLSRLDSESIYLANIILKSLRAFYDASNIRLKIFTLIQNAEIFLQKGMSDAAIKSFKKAGKLADEIGENTIILHVTDRIQSIIINTTRSVSKLGKLLVQQQNYSTDYLYGLKAIELYNHMLNQGDTHPDRKKYTTTELYQNFIKELEQTYKKCNKNYLFGRARVTEYLMIGNYFIDNYEKAYQYQVEKYLIYNSNSEYLNANILDYALSLVYLIDFCRLLNKPKEMHQYFYKLNQIKSIPLLDKSLLIKTAKIEYYTYVGNFDSAVSIIEQVKEDVIQDAKKREGEQQFMLYYLLFAIAFFGVKKYEDSLLWLHKFNLICNKRRMTTELFKEGLFLQIMLHYELNNELLQEYTIKKAYTHLGKIKLLSSYDKLLLKYIKQLFKMPRNRLDRIEIKKWVKELLKINPKIKQSLHIPLALYWLKSKANNESIGTVMKKNTQTK